MAQELNAVDESKSIRKFTPRQVRLAEVYFPILVSLAKHKHELTYKELILRARDENPGVPELETENPRNVGGTLYVIHEVCRQNDLPSLNALIINKSTGKCGAGIVKCDGINSQSDVEAQRDGTYDTDWSDVLVQFDSLIKLEARKAAPVKRLTKKEALDLFSGYALTNKATLDVEAVKSSRESIITDLMDGAHAVDVFAEFAK